MIKDKPTQDDLDRVWNIASKVSGSIGYGIGAIQWVAPQQNRKSEWFGYAFIIGREHAFISYDDFAKSDTELVSDCVQQILGYPLRSEQDYERRLAHLNDKIANLNNEIEALQARREKLAKDYAILLELKGIGGEPV